jgi:hypothetical protein
MKTHQCRVVSTVAIAQKIPAEVRLEQFTVEPDCRRYILLRGLLAVGGISDGIRLATCDFSEYRVFVVGSQQDSTRLL